MQKLSLRWYACLRFSLSDDKLSEGSYKTNSSSISVIENKLVDQMFLLDFNYRAFVKGTRDLLISQNR